MPDPRELAGAIAGRACVDVLRTSRGLGVMAENLPPIDPATFVAALADAKPKKLRLAILGVKRLDLAFPSSFDVTSSPTVVNAWRNDAEARSGTRFVALVLGPASKLNSIRTAVPVVEALQIRSRLVREAIQLHETPERTAFWRALESMSAEVALMALLRFAASAFQAAERSSANLLKQEPASVHLLGMVRYGNLFSRSGEVGARDAIRRSLALARKLRELSRREHAAVLANADDTSNDAQCRAAAQAILQYERIGDLALLAEFDLEQLSAALKRKKGLEPGEEGGHGPRPSKPIRREGDLVAKDLIIDEEGRGLVVAAKRFAEAWDSGGETAPEPISVNGEEITPRIRAGSSHAATVFAKLLTPTQWGGVITAADSADCVAALKRAASGDVEWRYFEPAEEQGSRWMLHRAVNQGMAPRSALEAWDAYAALREELLPHSTALADHPLLLLAGNVEARKHCEKLLAAYTRALESVKETADQLRQRGSIEPAKRLIARTVCLDIAFVRASEESVALLAPVHPFHVWRALEFLKLLEKSGKALRKISDELIDDAVLDPPGAAPNIVLSPFAVSEIGERAQAFVSVGQFGALLMYVEPGARRLASFRAKSISAIAQRLVRIMPHASLGLKVLLVDPPSLVSAVEALSEVHSPVDTERRVPLHVTVARTRAGREATAEEERDFETLAADLRDGGGKISMAPPGRTLRELGDVLSEDQFHLGVVFEPGDPREMRVGLSSIPAFSPLVMPRAYRYDPFDDRLDVIIAGESSAFGVYHAMFCEALDVPQADFVGRRSGASRTAREIEGLSRRCIWLSVVDQGLEPTLRIGAASRLDWRVEAGCDVVTFTGHPTTVTDLVRDAVRLSGLLPTEETVRRAIDELFSLSGESLFGLLSASPGLTLANARVAKGVMGVLAAVRWYQSTYPDSLVVSLDDPASRSWVLGRLGDDRHGDLLAVRRSKDGIVVEAIEVKTHNDPDAAVQEKGGHIEGKAAVQVDQTLSTLEALLASEVKAPLDKARREILRDQLYRAVASRQMTPDARHRQVEVLEGLFGGTAPVPRAMIFKVAIESGSTAISPSAPSMTGQTPSNRPVSIVELWETEVRSSAGGRPVVKPEPPAAELVGASERGKPAHLVAEARVSPATALRVLIGHSHADQEIFWDPDSPTRPLNNFGILVTGDSGTGKTQVLRAVVSEVAAAGIPVCVFDFKNDYAPRDFSSNARLTVYDVERDGLPFNPLSLIGDDTGLVKPINQVHEIAAILGRVFGLGTIQESMLKKAIRRTYEAAGIEVASRVEAEGTRAPSFDSVSGFLEHEKGSDKLLSRLEPLFDLKLFPASHAAQTSFGTLLESGVVLDLHRLPTDQIKAAMAEFIIVQTHGYLIRGEQPRKLKRLVVLDEAWRVGKSERLQALAREGRAFGVGIALGTQFPGDIPDEMAGNLETQVLLLNNNAEHRKVVCRILCATTSGPAAQSVMKQLQALKKHEAFMRNQQYSPYVLLTTLPHYQRVAPR